MANTSSSLRTVGSLSRTRGRRPGPAHSTTATPSRALRRTLALGLTRRRDLAAAVAAAKDDDQDTLDDLCERALEAGGSSTAAPTLGKALPQVRRADRQRRGSSRCPIRGGPTSTLLRSVPPSGNHRRAGRAGVCLPGVDGRRHLRPRHLRRAALHRRSEDGADPRLTWGSIATQLSCTPTHRRVRPRAGGTPRCPRSTRSRRS